MKPFKIVLLFAAMTVLCACPDDDGHRYITLVNKSGKSIAYQELIDWNGNPPFYCSNIGTITLINIPADSSRILESIGSSKWEDYLRKGQTMSIFIVDTETYNEHWLAPCDTIRKYVPVLHRYQLKLEDLQQMNWTVVYPPE